MLLFLNSLIFVELITKNLLYYEAETVNLHFVLISLKRNLFFQIFFFWEHSNFLLC